MGKWGTTVEIFQATLIGFTGLNLFSVSSNEISENVEFIQKIRFMTPVSFL